MVRGKLYEEVYRPQFHFTAKKNWLNDPNGLVYYKGEYHLFFQHNPSGIDWGNIVWGHAVSLDMVDWKQLANAIEPDELGMIFSGSGVVDWHNTAGFQSGKERAMVNIYTSAGKPFTQSIAYSNDGRISMSFCFLPDARNRNLKIYSSGGSIRIVSLKIYELGSIWSNSELEKADKENEDRERIFKYYRR